MGRPKKADSEIRPERKDAITRERTYRAKNREVLLLKSKERQRKKREDAEYNKKAKEWQAAYRKNNRDAIRRTNLKRTFGITLEEYENLYQRQLGLCAICGRPESDNVKTKDGLTRKLFVDHCHETLKIRGLLCQRCNFGIGLFQEEESFLRNAIRYLRKHRK